MLFLSENVLSNSSKFIVLPWLLCCVFTNVDPAACANDCVPPFIIVTLFFTLSSADFSVFSRCWKWLLSGSPSSWNVATRCILCVAGRACPANEGDWYCWVASGRSCFLVCS